MELLKAMLVEARVPSPDNVCRSALWASSQCKFCRQFYAAPCVPAETPSLTKKKSKAGWTRKYEKAKHKARSARKRWLRKGEVHQGKDTNPGGAHEGEHGRRAPTRNVAPRGAHEGEHGRRAPTRNVAPRGAHEGEHGTRGGACPKGVVAWHRAVPSRHRVVALSSARPV